MNFKDFIRSLTYAYERRNKLFINLKINGEYVNTLDITAIQENIKTGIEDEYYDYKVEKWYYPEICAIEKLTVCLVK